MTMQVIPPSGCIPRPDDLFELSLIAGRSPNNLPACLARVHTLTGEVRDRLSRHAWVGLRQFSGALSELADPSSSDMADRAADGLQQVLLLAAAVRGTLETMVRGYTWGFLQIGQRLERASTALSTMQAFLPMGATRHHMSALLEASDSLLAYRARYLTTWRIAPVVDLLLTDKTNPHSVLFQVEELLRHTATLPRESAAALSAPERGLVQLQARLLATDVVQVCAGDGNELRRVLADASDAIRRIGEDIAREYFSHAPPSATADTPEWLDTGEF